ncbi:hypothetical protein RRG08_024286 [Elysia crispata]|uniref:Uncharacterized protein n=1 Tax=Elysia crispata TaxID=231223 RepID=A0AAE1DJ57_9GAST|nr:hypothetical protein RRG08_024286 [Elysia crispata]
MRISDTCPAITRSLAHGVDRSSESSAQAYNGEVRIRVFCRIQSSTGQLPLKSRPDTERDGHTTYSPTLGSQGLQKYLVMEVIYMIVL